MSFFFFVRLFGGLWFQAEFVYTELPWVVGFLVNAFFWGFGCFVKLRVLTKLSNFKVLVLAFIFTTITRLFILWDAPFWQYNILETVIVFAVPLIALKDRLGVSQMFKKAKLPKWLQWLRRNWFQQVLLSLALMAGIIAYQWLVIIGRGYPLMARMCPIWMTIGGLDYHLFLLGLMLLKTTGVWTILWGMLKTFLCKLRQLVGKVSVAGGFSTKKRDKQQED